MLSLLPSSCCPCWFRPVTSTESIIDTTLDDEFTGNDLFDLNGDCSADDQDELIDLTQLLLSKTYDFDDGIGMPNEEWVERSFTHIPKASTYFDPTF